MLSWSSGQTSGSLVGMQGTLKGNLSLCVAHERVWNHVQTVTVPLLGWSACAQRKASPSQQTNLLELLPLRKQHHRAAGTPHIWVSSGSTCWAAADAQEGNSWPAASSGPALSAVHSLALLGGLFISFPVWHWACTGLWMASFWAISISG